MHSNQKLAKYIVTNRELTVQAFKFKLLRIILGTSLIFLMSFPIGIISAETIVISGKSLSKVSAFRIAQKESNEPGVMRKNPKNWPWRGILIHSCCGGAAPKDLENLAELGVNAVVLNIKARMQAKRELLTPQIAWSKSLAWVDSMLDACKMHGIVGIVRLNQLPIDPKLKIHEKSPEFWDNPARWKEVVDLAGEIARHFGKRGDELGAYVFLSEPSVRGPGIKKRPENWPEVLNLIIREIRKYDPNRYIVVTPGPGGSPRNYMAYKPLGDPRIIYGAHMYLPHAFTHQGAKGRPVGVNYPGSIKKNFWNKDKLKVAVKPLADFQKKYGVLVFIGEFSAVRYAKGTDQYVSDVIKIFDENGWGWTYFLFKGNKLWNPDYNAQGYVGPDSSRWKLLKRAYLSNGFKK